MNYLLYDEIVVKISDQWDLIWLIFGKAVEFTISHCCFCTAAKFFSSESGSPALGASAPPRRHHQGAPLPPPPSRGQQQRCQRALAVLEHG
jgi:hypothetical protein